MQKVLIGTPLEESFAQCYRAIERHQFATVDFVTLAAARAALQGALHDTLQQQARRWLGRSEVIGSATAQTTEGEPPTQAGRDAPAWVESARHWLMELALAGFARLEATMLTSFWPTLEQLQAEPDLVGQASLLTGFFYELLRAIPVRNGTEAPIYRWVDLWSRGMLGTLPATRSRSAKPVSGVLRLLGMDIHQHDHFISLVGYGLLQVEMEQKPRWVRIRFSAYKVDAIQGDEMWLLLSQAETVLAALAQRQSLELRMMPLLPGGDLIWEGEARAGHRYDLLAEAQRYLTPNNTEPFVPPATPPLDRHPVQVAEPVYLTGYTVAQAEAEMLQLTWGDGEALPVALARLNSLAGLDAKTIGQSTAMAGLLRFDAGVWSVQPLAIRMGRPGKVIAAGEGGAAVLKKPPKASVVAILQERASRLLRAG